MQGPRLPRDTCRAVLTHQGMDYPTHGYSREECPWIQTQQMMALQIEKLKQRPAVVLCGNTA